ncbi:amidohydrolase [Croceimicrobium sp.]|uniref:amidohydrolase n=1 Tax=Croceimicrobium sp. TaxID=2828340 RepID=UPI003BA8C541
MEARALRHHLHQNPELSGQEFQSQKLLQELLSELQIFQIETVGGTSLIAHYDSAKEGTHLLIRADFDALPIDEPNELEYRSQKPGVSHKCGHDGHTAILYSVAKQIAKQPPKTGKLSLLFQASEENGQGAAKVLADPAFAKYDYHFAYALHNIPAYPLAEVLWRSGNFSAGVSSLAFEWKGLETHAAHPWEGINPARAIAKLTEAAAHAEKQDPNHEDFFLCTPVYSLLGAKNYGISPAQGELHFTARAWRGDYLDQQIKALKRLAQKEAEAQGMQLEVSRFEEFWPIRNHPEALNYLQRALKELDQSNRALEQAFTWGEDFGLFIKDKPGLMFGLGAGEDCKVLHHPEYDFPDPLIEEGAKIFLQLIALHLDG